MEITTLQCNPMAQVSRFYNCTAGILAMMRPCRIIVSHCDIRQRAVPKCLHGSCASAQATEGAFDNIGYERACELDPFITRLHQRGNAGAADIAKNTQFLMDIWHCEKHSRNTCMPLEDNDDCR